jgi:hypothetical protein
VIGLVSWERLLIGRISDGDGDALLELRDRIGDAVSARVQQITNDHLVAMFVTAGVFARLWSCPAEFDVRDPLAALLGLAEKRSYQWLASSAGVWSTPERPAPERSVGERSTADAPLWIPRVAEEPEPEWS